jgi:hypothetical protein
MKLHRWVAGVAVAIALGCGHAQARQPIARVVEVQPSGPEVPANLLRISLRFAASVEGSLLPRLSLVRTDGGPIEEPFLEQELWSPNGKVLTILLHPGRVKGGLVAHDAMGPILSAGHEVVLALDGRAIKRWRVGPADVSGPVVSAWKLAEVRVGSKQPLVVALDGPIDGREADYLAIADARNGRVPGHAQLTNGENTWTFTPDAPWRAGTYRLIVRGTLEDSAGNRLGGHFETSADSPPEQPVDVTVPFAVGEARAREATRRCLPDGWSPEIATSRMNHDLAARSLPTTAMHRRGAVRCAAGQLRRGARLREACDRAS